MLSISAFPSFSNQSLCPYLAKSFFQVDPDCHCVLLSLEAVFDLLCNCNVSHLGSSKSVSRCSFSRNQTSLELIILSSSFHRQLVGFAIALCFVLRFSLLEDRFLNTVPHTGFGADGSHFS